MGEKVDVRRSDFNRSTTEDTKTSCVHKGMNLRQNNFPTCATNC